MFKFYTIAICFIFFLNACNSSADTAAGENKTNDFIELLKDSVDAHPDSSVLRTQLMYAYDSIGDYKNALLQSDKLILQDSLNYGLWFAKGEIASHAGDTSAALQAYKYAGNIYPSPDALLSIANLYAEKRNDSALLFCSKVEALNMGKEYSAHCAFINGIYYSRTNDKAKALQSFDDCLNNNYTYMEAYIEKGLVYFDEKKYDDALKVFKLASTVNNLYADAYYYQARCYEEMNVKDSAVLRFKQSLQLDNTLSEAHEHLQDLGADN